jgi:hypothetical protein
VTIDWPTWVQNLHAWDGVMFDHGFIPKSRITLIGPLDEKTGEPKKLFEGNVVPLKR